MQQKNGTLLTLNQRVTIHENLIKFLTKSLESSFCDYSNAYILVTGNIIVEGSDNNTKVALKYCAPLRKCRTEINDTFIDETEQLIL